MQVELLPADTLYIRAEDASVTEVLESIAEAMNADIIGIETLETEERVSCDLEVPLIRALAWLAPHMSCRTDGMENELVFTEARCSMVT